MTTEHTSFYFGLVIDPADSDSEITESDFRNTIADLRAFLTDIETDISGETPHVRWVWDAEPEIRLRAEVNGVNAATLGAIVSTGQIGFEAVRDPEAAQNVALPDEARRRLATIVNRLTKYASITVTATDKLPVVIDPEQKDIARATSSGSIFTEFSEVDGVLDVINMHGSPHFVIFEHSSGRRVRCALPDELLPQVKEALRSRVVVEGLVRYRLDGTPISIREVTSFAILPEPVNSILAMEGQMPGLSGDLESGEFIRQMREADG